MSKAAVAVLLWIARGGCATAAATDPLAAGFQRPPDSAKPWTYWFWMNGNITREGITADLEAMASVGIHGVLIMEVARPKQMAPAGPVPFASPAWRELFRHAVTEMARLGMEINMNNDAGWSGSCGPWNEPEFSRQKLVWTSSAVEGTRHSAEMLPQPGWPRRASMCRIAAWSGGRGKPTGSSAGSSAGSWHRGRSDFF